MVADALTSAPRLVPRGRIALPVLAVAAVLVTIGSLAVGALPIPVADVMAILAGRGTDPIATSVVLELRLPRALLGALVGAALGSAGAALQGLFRNPLADPTLVGVSSGAALAAVASIVFAPALALLAPPALHPFMTPGAAFAGGLAAAYLVFRLGSVDGARSTATLLLAGIAINAMMMAGMGLLLFLSNDQQLREATFWTMGSVARGGWPGLLAVAPAILLALAALPFQAGALNALLLGEREAGHLGVDVTRLKTVIVVLVSLAVGAAVAATGIIAFIGVVVPHVVRLALGGDQRAGLLGSACLGAVLLVVADCIARSIAAPAELPVGIVTSAIGAPFFLALLIGRRGALR